MLRLAFLLAALALFTHCTEGRPPVRADDAKPSDAATQVVHASVSAAPAPAVLDASPAQKAYVDPDTGELIPRPAQDESAEGNAIRPAALGSADEKIEIKSSPVEGGGIMVDVKGRFQNPIKATVDGQSGSKIDHAADDETE